MLRAPSQSADGLPSARRGEPMLATVAGVAGHAITVIEIGQDGAARALFPADRLKDGAMLRPIRIAPDSLPGPLLLVAISGQDPVPPDAIPGSAEALFRRLAERATSGGEVSAYALRVVSVQP